jgi:hypothetical protein
MTILNEGLKYMDMEHQVIPKAGIDLYKSKIGPDEDYITVSFVVKGRECADDLVTWLERGYDWVVDADTSPGEVVDGKYYVFAELNRKPSTAGRIIELISDLETLTGLSPKDWELVIGEEKYPATEEVVRQHVDLTPQRYREDQDGELNEWRDIAGLDAAPLFDSQDPELLAMQRQAGIK